MKTLNEQTSEQTFDDFTAVGIAEGFLECDSQEDMLKAWQHLENSGLGRSLQGWFGRRQEELIASGKIKRKVA
jgi:uncharacterized protein YidB (DUF937 family)